MITKFKIFENIEDRPKVGDYVICNVSPYTTDKELIDFVDNNIGKIVKLSINGYIVEYYEVPINLEKWYFGVNSVRHFGENDILLYASTKEELETKIKANKFNL